MDPSCTPLHCACFNGSLDCVRLLIEKGRAKATEVTSKGWSALHFASAGGHLDIVIYLVQAHVGISNNEGLTPWELASQNNHQNIVHYFVEGCKFDIKGATRVPGQATLSHTRQNPSNDVLERLAEKMDELCTTVSDVRNTVRGNDINMERLLNAVAHAATHDVQKCPTLVWLVPAERIAVSSIATVGQWLKNLTHKTFKLYFVCQHSYEVVETNMTIPVTREWFVQAAPALYYSIILLRLALTIYCIPLPFPMPELKDDVKKISINEEFLAEFLDANTKKLMDAFKDVCKNSSDSSVLDAASLQNLTGKGYEAIAEQAISTGHSQWMDSMEAVTSHLGPTIWIKKKYRDYFSPRNDSFV